MKFAFVILHYMTYEDTAECIDSIIKNIKNKDYSIVLVDNDSPNNSYSRLKNKYKEISNVHFIKNTQNLGFAKGNNKGYEYAKKVLNVDFIVMINNDTLVEQPLFLDYILEAYGKYHPHIIGPDIISTVDYSHQNPQRYEVLSKRDVKKLININRIYLFLLKTKLEKVTLSIYRYLKNGVMKKNIKYPINTKEKLEIMENVELHGSCLIFTPLFISEYKGLFDETYMFFEEHILFYIARNEKLRMLYYPELKILHKEDASTDALFKKSDEKRIFVHLNSIKSAKLLLKIMKDSEYYRNNMLEENNK